MGTASEYTLKLILDELEGLTLPTGAATETTLAAILVKLADPATQTTLAALLTELQAKADLTETQPVSAASLPLPSGAATETTVAAILAAMVNRATTPVVYNVTMTNANTEYSQALPANTKKFLIRCRGSYAIKVCFTSGASGTTYVTVPSGCTYNEDFVQPSTITLYFQCATAAQVAEIIAWS